MTRLLFWPSSIILLLGVLVLPACGQQDTADVVSADCSGHVPREKVDSCLERARVIDETDPSAPLKPLEAELERRARHLDGVASGPPRGPDQGPPPGYDPDQQPPPNYGPDDQARQGARSDEPPPPDSRSSDQTPPADQTGSGEITPPDNGPQGPPPDNTPPPDDSETQGPGQ